MTLTADRLREVLDYDPVTGQFAWAISTKGHIQKGRRAGTECASHPYRQLSVDGKVYLEHRLAWLHVHGEWPRYFIDHIDINPRNNRIANLREATREQNVWNSSSARSKTSKHRGVSWHAGNKKWRASIHMNGRAKTIGYYASEDEAAAAYRVASIALHKEFSPFPSLVEASAPGASAGEMAAMVSQIEGMKRLLKERSK